MKGKIDTKTKHLFVSDIDGSLYDTRKPRWSSRRPLRYGFNRNYADIRNCQQLKATLRYGQWAWPGGYPIYFITDDGQALSFEAVLAELRSVLWSVKFEVNDGWRVVGTAINYEDTDLTCAHTDKRIESAYGDDDE